VSAVLEPTATAPATGAEAPPAARAREPVATPSVAGTSAPGAAEGAAAASSAPRTRNPAADSPRTLDAAFRRFARAPSVRIMGSALAAALCVRVWLGGFSFWDLVVVGAFALYQPFQEWWIHVFVLHFRPRKVLGRTVDPLLARRHRRHHENPSHLDDIFIPLPAVWWSMAFHPLLWYLLLPTPALAASATAVVVAIGLLYEWTHFLIHTSYAPRSWLYRGIWRLHRLHHYKNEGYWFGVTNHLGDRVLGTNPDPKTVPLSPTARTLGVRPEVAAPTEAA
jgi:hypothetical protein